MEALEIALLDFPLRAQIDLRSFSFYEFWRGAAADLSGQPEDTLLDWMAHAFFQFRKLERFLECDDGSTGRLSMAASGRRRQPHATPRPDAALDQPGNAILAMLEKAGGRLRAAEARIGQLTTELGSTQERATHAEHWLQLLESEIVDRLTASKAAVRPRVDGRR